MIRILSAKNCLENFPDPTVVDCKFGMQKVIGVGGLLLGVGRSGKDCAVDCAKNFFEM